MNKYFGMCVYICFKSLINDKFLKLFLGKEYSLFPQNKEYQILSHLWWLMEIDGILTNLKTGLRGGGGSPPLLYPNGSKLRNLLDTPEH